MLAEITAIGEILTPVPCTKMEGLLAVVVMLIASDKSPNANGVNLTVNVLVSNGAITTGIAGRRDRAKFVPTPNAIVFRVNANPPLLVKVTTIPADVIATTVSGKAIGEEGENPNEAPATALPVTDAVKGEPLVPGSAKMVMVSLNVANDTGENLKIKVKLSLFPNTTGKVGNPTSVKGAPVTRNAESTLTGNPPRFETVIEMSAVDPFAICPKSYGPVGDTRINAGFGITSGGIPPIGITILSYRHPIHPV
jgi:hypothetical protein